MIGILAAIAIPNFIAYRDRAFQVAVESELEILANAEKGYFTQNGHYSSDFEAINYFTFSVPIHPAQQRCENLGICLIFLSFRALPSGCLNIRKSANLFLREP